MDKKENGGLTPGGFNIDLEEMARRIIEKYSGEFEKFSSKKNKLHPSNVKKFQSSKKLYKKAEINKH